MILAAFQYQRQGIREPISPPSLTFAAAALAFTPRPPLALGAAAAGGAFTTSQPSDSPLLSPSEIIGVTGGSTAAWCARIASREGTHTVKTDTPAETVNC